MQELENENKNLGHEYLKILKKQEQFTRKDGEQSTMADTREENEMGVIKDKQIDHLSMMLAQKEVEVKRIKLQHEEETKEIDQKHQ